MNLRSQINNMTPYEVHKALMKDYILKKPPTKCKTDYDVLKEHHKFLWDKKSPSTWEEQFAKKYYDKLFKEYCIGDLSRYKENKIALRWRTEQEVVIGKGQFACGNKTCECKDSLRTWEVNFAYQEEGEKKNALVKIRLCDACSIKLNYKTKKKEVKRLKKRKGNNPSRNKALADKSTTLESIESGCTLDESSTSEHSENPTPSPSLGESAWDQHAPVETKSRDEEMEDYLNDLLL